jgi:hypothetical protein
VLSSCGSTGFNLYSLAGGDDDVHLEAAREHAKELDADGEPDEGRHAAVWHRGGEGYRDAMRAVVHLHVPLAHHVELRHVKKIYIKPARQRGITTHA